MSDEYIYNKRNISISFKALLIFLLCTLTITANSNVAEQQYLLHIENTELSLVEMEFPQQSSQASCSVKRRIRDNCINSFAHHSHIYYWASLKFREHHSYSRSLFRQKDIIHYYCVLRI